MHDLAQEFGLLIDAARQGRFEQALASSILADKAARYHPLNFVAIRAEDGAGLGLRLHLWDSRFRFGQQGFEVHDHVFDLDSFVVSGTVRQTLYEAESTDEGELAAYEVQYGTHAALLKAVHDRLKLNVTRVDDFSEGQRYELPPRVLHRLELVTLAAITLVLTRMGAGSPVSIGPAAYSPPPLIKRLPIRNSLGRDMTVAADGVDAILARARDTALATTRI